MLTGEPTGRRISGRPRRRWEVNIRMDIKESHKVYFGRNTFLL